MRNNNSFLYPQGFHIGHLYLLIKHIGDRDFSAPFNPETYWPRAYGQELSGTSRQLRYKIWALMEIGILEDQRETDNHLSYQNLTEKGRRIYDLLNTLEFPDNFFDRPADDSWDMTYGEKNFIQFTQSLENLCPELFELFKTSFLEMHASQDLIKYFVEKRIKHIEKDELYINYFNKNYVQETYRQNDLRPPSRSIGTARRRLSVIIGLLESVNVLKGWGERDTPISILEMPSDIFNKKEAEIETQIQHSIAPLTTEQITERLSALQVELEAVQPVVNDSDTIKTSSPKYPRNKELELLMKRKANYHCQNCNTEGFLKENDTKYIECHHMIPMRLGDACGSNPDVPSNILVICSWCHVKLEYGTHELKESIYLDLLGRSIVTEVKIGELMAFDII